ncbi:MAG: nucleoside hydrolase-like domain-containing protein [Bacteroidia bacterium]
MNKLILIVPLLIFYACTSSNEENLTKPRILISTDIGGTDPDDNQSMIHFLMYSDMFQTEGLISSPSYGFGAKQNILDMIALYERDLPKLKEHSSDYPSPNSLRALCKQGRQGAAPFMGYTTATEGSDWIIKCAKKESEEPLWILVWGGLDDLAQALHDAPEIKNKIKVYWIGGPNKKWSTNSYSYIVESFPDLWFIEANAAYRGFFSNSNSPDSLRNEEYYQYFINEAGYLGEDFKNYYEGNIKMGDTPSLLYVMNGDLDDPQSDSWGGRFGKTTYSPKFIFNRTTSIEDTVSVYSIVEYKIKGPIIDFPPDSACFTMTVYAGVGKQKWSGYYLGKGKYAIRYAPKKAETLTYEITSQIPGFPEQKGSLVVNNIWPGGTSVNAYKLGANWYTELSDPELYDNGWQGAQTVLQWRNDALMDWGQRWSWLK